MLAYVVSTAAHAAVILGFVFLHTQPPRLTSSKFIEVSITGNETRTPPLVRRAPVPAEKPRVTSEQSDTPAPAPIPAEAERDSGEKAVAEARYDVAALNNPKPPYPLAARRQGIEGRVVLLALVHADGSCGDVTIQQSSGHALLDRVALETVRKWRFIPARRALQAIEAWVQIPIAFRLADAAG